MEVPRLNSKFGDICRLCLRTGRSMSSIYTEPNEETNLKHIAKRISTIADVKIGPDDKLPASICDNCRNDVNKFFQFRLLVEASDKALRQCLKSSQTFFQTNHTSSGVKADINITNTTPKTTKPQLTADPQIAEVVEPDLVAVKVELLEDLSENVEESGQEGQVHCELCFASYDSEDKLKEHILEHCSEPPESLFVEVSSSEGQYKLKIVDAPAPETKIKHKTAKTTETDSPARKVECKDCHKWILVGNALRHSNKCPKTRKDLICTECGRKFARTSELKYHMGSHSTTPLTCEYCGKIFYYEQSFTIHLKRHTEIGRFKCDVCEKRYFTNSELSRHVQTHLREKTYRCPVCQTTFASKPELTRHLKYHNGTKKFQCKICGKSYYESGHLKVHLRHHTGERPYICDMCDKGFVTKSKLIRHRKIHEKAQEPVGESVTSEY